MGSDDKRREALRRATAGVRFGLLSAVLQAAGYVAQPGRGSHVVFRHAETGRHITIPHHGDFVKQAYVRQVLELLEQDDGRD